MNVALTAIGSMSAEAAIKSLRNSNIDAIIGFDIYPKEWIVTSKLVDLFYRVPLAYEKEYVETIFDICLKNRVQFVIPLTDLEVDVLSIYSREFQEHGITLCLPKQNTVATARDKLKIHNFFKDNSEILVIPTFEELEKIDVGSCEEIIAKPRKGRSSEGVIRLSDPQDTKNFITLKNSCLKGDDYIFQPKINGTFITVDTIRDSSNNHASISRKELLRTVNGAGIVVELFRDEELEKLVNNITDSLDIIGCVNIEFILSKNKYFLMDINPRFSAGIGFSVIAGYDFIGNHLKCFQGTSIDQRVHYKNQILSKRYVDHIHE